MHQECDLRSQHLLPSAQGSNLRNKQKTLSTLIAPAILCLTVASNSHGAIIFADDFSRSGSSNVGNQWLEWEKDSNDVAISQQQLRLRDHQTGTTDAAAWHTIDAIGFDNLELTFDWRALNSTETSDSLYAGHRDGDGIYHSFWSTSLGGSHFEQVSLTLGGSYSNSAFDLAFWIDVGASNETVYLDNVIIDGVQITPPVVTPPTDFLPTPPTTPATPVASVNEPTSLALLSLGLLGMSARPRRPKKQS